MPPEIENAPFLCAGHWSWNDIRIIVTCKIQVTAVQCVSEPGVSRSGRTSGPVPSAGRDTMKFQRSSCPITNVLDLLGDKWTLLVIRDLVLGKRRYQEFLSSPEAMASNILAERLSRLQRSGLIRRRAYQHNPPRYEYLLTTKGKGLEPILEAIIAWGKRQYPGSRRFPRVERSNEDSKRRSQAGKHEKGGQINR